jgi:hypothetical protein
MARGALSCSTVHLPHRHFSSTFASTLAGAATAAGGASATTVAEVVGAASPVGPPGATTPGSDMLSISITGAVGKVDGLGDPNKDNTVAVRTNAGGATLTLTLDDVDADVLSLTLLLALTSDANDETEDDDRLESDRINDDEDGLKLDEDAANDAAVPDNWWDNLRSTAATDVSVVVVGNSLVLVLLVTWLVEGEDRVGVGVSLGSCERWRFCGDWSGKASIDIDDDVFNAIQMLDLQASYWYLTDDGLPCHHSNSNNNNNSNMTIN